VSTIPFPNAAFTHPQAEWNEMELVMRMLNQNSIPIRMVESGTGVTVSLDPAQSMNVIAMGGADLSANISLTTHTNDTRWIYVRADGSSFDVRAERPDWNPYLHGWYHRVRGDRAVVFIDAELPPGQRCFLLDSPNSMYEYDTRIPLTGGDYTDITPALTAGQALPFSLYPGNYRIEIKGGRGGTGGNSGLTTVRTNIGGSGGDGETRIFRLRVLSVISGTIMRGRDGANGGNGVIGGGFAMGPAHMIQNRQFITGSATGGGGGASGEDTRILLDGLLWRARGGAGGGGGAPSILNSSANMDGNVANTSQPHSIFSGGGGGGAGNPTGAGNGTVIPHNVIYWLAAKPGLAGSLQRGGEGGAPDWLEQWGNIEWTWRWRLGGLPVWDGTATDEWGAFATERQRFGFSGESIDETDPRNTHFRRGGTGGAILPFMGHGDSIAVINNGVSGGEGGISLLNTSATSFIRILKFNRITN